MLNKIGTTVCLVACLVSIGAASSSTSSIFKRAKKFAETRRRLSEYDVSGACLEAAFAFFALTQSGGVCEGLDLEGTEDHTALCGTACFDPLLDALGRMVDKCGDLDACDEEYEVTHDDVCVTDCSSDSSLCDDEYEDGQQFTCQNGKCLPPDGSTPEVPTFEEIRAIMEFTCVTHPDGELCWDKAMFLVDSNLTGSCDQFEGLGCCYGWAKKLAGCIGEDDAWTQTTDETDQYLNNCPNAGLSTTPCAGTPSTCGASGLTMSLLVSFVSVLLYALNQ